MRQDGRRFYSYFIAILFILGVVLVCNVLLQKDKEDYSRAEFLKDMEAGRVTAVEIQLNSETPTGALFIDLKNGDKKTLYVADIIEMEEIVRSYDFDPMVLSPAENSLARLLPKFIIFAFPALAFMFWALIIIKRKTPTTITISMGTNVVRNQLSRTTS